MGYHSLTFPDWSLIDSMGGFPFVVGVTGHRDLAHSCLDGARAAVRSTLESLQRQFEGVAIEITCGLAAGADQLVAEVALELGIGVHAVLPMPKAIYRNDFSGEELAKLDKLLGNPKVSVDEIPLPPGMDRQAVSATGPQRDRLYARLGDYLRRRANLLLALWDGQVSGLEGGTCDVVLRYLEASSADKPFAGELEIRPGEPHEVTNSPVAIWIRVDRAQQHTPGAGQVSYLAGGARAGQVLSFANLPAPVQERLSALGEHVVEYRGLVQAGKLEPGWSLLGDLDTGLLPAELVSRLRSIDEAYVRVDGLALYNQRRSDRTFAAFGLMAGLMGLLFLLYAKIAALKVFLVGYLVLFAGGFLAYRLAGQRHWFTRHLVYRVLAESLRVHFFMAVSGSDDRKDVARLFDLTGMRRFPGFGWVVDALRIAAPLATDRLALDDSRVNLARRLWIADQAEYFKRKTHVLHLEHERLEKIKRFLFLLSFAGMLGLVLLKKLLAGVSISADVDLKTLLVFLIGLLPLWLGIWEIYQNKMAVRELLWQYRNQADLFAAAAARLESAASDAERRSVLHDLADRSLHEVYLWAIHRFHREHEPPSAA